MGMDGTDVEQFIGIVAERKGEEGVGVSTDECANKVETLDVNVEEANTGDAVQVNGLVQGEDANVSTVDTGFGVLEQKDEQETSTGIDEEAEGITGERDLSAEVVVDADDLTMHEDNARPEPVSVDEQAADERDVREPEENMTGLDKGAEEVKSEGLEVGQGSTSEKDVNKSSSGEKTKEMRDGIVHADEVGEDGVWMLESESAGPDVPEKKDVQESELNTTEIMEVEEMRISREGRTAEVIQSEAVNVPQTDATEESEAGHAMQEGGEGGNGSEQRRTAQIIEDADAKAFPIVEAISASNLNEEIDTAQEIRGKREKPDETNHITMLKSVFNHDALSEEMTEEESGVKSTEGNMEKQTESKTVVETGNIEMVDGNAVSGTLLEQKDEEKNSVGTAVVEEMANQEKGANIVDLQNVNMSKAYTGPESVLEEVIKENDIETVEAGVKNKVQHMGANLAGVKDVNITEDVDTEAQQSKFTERDDIGKKTIVVQDVKVPEEGVREKAEDEVNMHPLEDVNTRKYYDAYKVEANGTRNEDVEEAKVPECIDKVVPVEEAKMLAAETVILPVVKDEKYCDIQGEARKEFEETSYTEEKMEPGDKNKALGESVKKSEESSARKKKEKLEKEVVRFEEIECTGKMEVDAEEEYFETEEDFKKREKENKKAKTSNENKQAKTSSRKRSGGQRKGKKRLSQKKERKLLSTPSNYGIEMKKSMEKYEDGTKRKKEEKQELNEAGTEKVMKKNSRIEGEDSKEDLMEMEEDYKQSDGESEEAKSSSSNQGNLAKIEKQKKESQETEKEVSSTHVTSPSERPVRERKSVERLVEVLEREQVKKFVIEKGCGTPLKEIPHVAHRLVRKKPADLKMLHQILFGRVGKAADFKNHILQFSGFPWHESEEKQRTKTKEKLDKYVKNTLLELCDLFDLRVTSRSNARKEEIVAMLLDFIAVPQATKYSSPSSKEQQSTKPKKRKKEGTVSASKSSKGVISAKWSRKKRSKKESTSKAKGKSDYESEEEEEQDAENDVHEGDEVSMHSELEASMHSEPDEKETEFEVDHDSEKSDENSRRSSRSLKMDSKASSSFSKAKTIYSPKKIIIPCSTTAVPSRKSAPKRPQDDIHDKASTKVFSRKKRIDSPKKKSKSTTHDEEKPSGKAVTKDKAKSKGSKETWPSKEDLRKTICEILDRVDFNTATFTDILKLLISHYDTDLTSRKMSIKDIIQEELTRLANEVQDDQRGNVSGSDSGSDNDDDESDSDDSPKPKRRYIAA